MWYVVQVLGGQEKATLELVERFVADDAYGEVFIPQREVMRHRSGEWVKTLEILFPGYLFVVTRDPGRLFGQLAAVPAFTRLLGSDEAFVPLSDEEMRIIRAFMGDDHVVEMSEGVIEGDEVRILRGPLRDCDARIVKVDRHKRAAYVMLRILGRDTTVKLGLEILRKA